MTCALVVIALQIKMPINNLIHIYYFKHGPKDGLKIVNTEKPFNWVLFSRPIEIPTHSIGNYAWTPECMNTLIGGPAEDGNLTKNLSADKLYAAYRLQWVPDKNTEVTIGTVKAIGAKGIYTFFRYLVKPS